MGRNLEVSVTGRKWHFGKHDKSLTGPWASALVASFRLFAQTLMVSGKAREIWDPSGKGP
jgi:hypothetical protein